MNTKTFRFILPPFETGIGCRSCNKPQPETPIRSHCFGAGTAETIKSSTSDRLQTNEFGLGVGSVSTQIVDLQNLIPRAVAMWESPPQTAELSTAKTVGNLR